MKANQATFPVRVMSRLLGVSASGFYAWLQRPLSARAVADIGLTALIHAIHRRSNGAYGAPSIHAELADDHARRVGKKRVARLMRAANLRGLHPRRFVTTTIGDPVADRALDHVDRHFAAEGPDRLWVADITYIPTWAGFLYLAVVLDVWSRRIVGWAIEPHLKTELVLSALNIALMQRRPQGVIHHSDRGCQYTSYAFGKRCQEAGVMPSMGSTGDAYDNAMAESFFATLEREVLDRRRFQSQAEAPSSSGSRAGTIRTGATPPSATCHPLTTRGDSCSRALETQVRTRPRNRGRPTVEFLFRQTKRFKVPIPTFFRLPDPVRFDFNVWPTKRNPLQVTKAGSEPNCLGLFE